MLLFIHRQWACAESPATAHVAPGVLRGKSHGAKPPFRNMGFSGLMQIMIITHKLCQIVLLIPFLFPRCVFHMASLKDYNVAQSWGCSWGSWSAFLALPAFHHRTPLDGALPEEGSEHLKHTRETSFRSPRGAIPWCGQYWESAVGTKNVYCSVPWVRAVLLVGMVEELGETSRGNFLWKGFWFGSWPCSSWSFGVGGHRNRAADTAPSS